MERIDLQELLQEQSCFLSTMNDSSTDSGISEQELVYVRVLSHDYEPTTKFLSIKKLPNGDAKNIMDAVVHSLEQDGKCLDWRDKLVSCIVDGAAVMTGSISGVVTRMKEEAPHLIGIHCTAHRLELAIRDGAKSMGFLTEVDTMLQKLYKFYHYSAKNWEGLQTCSQALAVSIRKPPNIMGTRWIAHREREQYQSF